MLPGREWRIAVADHARSPLDEERQQTAEDSRRDGRHTVRCEQCSEQVSVAQRIDDPQLRPPPRRQAEVHADRSDVPGAAPPAGYQRVSRLAAVIDDSPPTL